MIDVDFNAVTEDGLVVVRVSSFAVPPMVDDVIEINEFGEDIMGQARVVVVKPNGLVYLDIDWQSLHDIASGDPYSRSRCSVRKPMSVQPPP